MACYDICPVNAITTKTVGGFYYPSIQNDKCINCLSCSSVCPVLSKDYSGQVLEKAVCYVAYAKDDEFRKNSSSGGIFPVFAKTTLAENGVVGGAQYDKSLNVRQVLVSEKNDLFSLCRSKYVQSDAKGIHKSIKSALEENKNVTFCGTPCQIAGLDQFVRGYDKSNLTLVTFACHGVPSPVIFKLYCKWLENKYRDKLTRFDFRCKEYGWTAGFYAQAFFEKKGVVTLKFFNNWFLRSFVFFDHALRPSCTSCKFRWRPVSDIVLADFWAFRSLYTSRIHVNVDEVSPLFLLTLKKEESFWINVQISCL